MTALPPLSPPATPLVIELHWAGDEDDPSPIGLVVPHPTGIWYKQQTAGHLCNHPVMEGFYVPLPPTCSPSERLENEGGRYSITRVQALLDSNEALRRVLRPLTRKEQAETVGWQHFEEAWVPLVVRKDPKEGAWEEAELLKPLRGRVVLLTYPNSD